MPTRWSIDTSDLCSRHADKVEMVEDSGGDYVLLEEYWEDVDYRDERISDLEVDLADVQSERDDLYDLNDSLNETIAELNNLIKELENESG